MRHNTSIQRRHRFPAALALYACTSVAAYAQAVLPTTVVELDGVAFTVEVADDNSERMRGLMFRETMPTDAGMVFVFEEELPLSFWMKNTRIPLDMLYFNREARFVSVQRDVPPCRTAYCPSYPSDGLAQYVLELNGGRSASLKLDGNAVLCERQRPQLTPLPSCDARN